MGRFGSTLAAFLLSSPLVAAHAGCFVNTSGMNLGAYDVFDPIPRDSTATLTVSCQEVVSRTVSITIGPSANSGSISQRQMKQAAGGDILNYNLFIDPGRTQVWGDGTSAGSVVVQGNISSASPRQVMVYGRIPAGQDVSAGNNYGDVVIVTVNIIR